MIKPIDEDVIDQGYDSDGLRAPWEMNEKEDLDGPLEEEDPLPFGIAPLPPVVPIAESFAQKNITVEEVQPLKVLALKEELKKKRTGYKWIKSRIGK